MTDPTVVPTAPQQPVSPQAKPKSIIGAVISIGVLLFILYYFFGGGVENKVATDAVDQYNIAARNGSAMDRCVQAGIVAAAYLQAKDEAKYSQWKETEKADCEAAGVPEP